MRNTSKSESLIRTRAVRDEHPGASDFVDDSTLPEAGVRNRSAAMRSARAELSTRARAVENMNEAVNPQS